MAWLMAAAAAGGMLVGFVWGLWLQWRRLVGVHSGGAVTLLGERQGYVVVRVRLGVDLVAGLGDPEVAAGLAEEIAEALS